MNPSNKGCGCKDRQAKFVMPDELKAKLREILRDFSGSSPDGQWGDRAIAQIDQAYKDAGCARVRKNPYRDEQRREYTQYTIDYPGGSGEFFRVPRFEVMTGQEWYERFEKEFEFIEVPEITSNTKAGDFVQAAIDGARAAAKRAAGLE